jgi:hypothetical protein
MRTFGLEHAVAVWFTNMHVLLCSYMVDLKSEHPTKLSP